MIISLTTPAGWLKLLIVTCWITLFILLLRRDVFIATIDPKELETIKQAESEEYQSIFFKNAKIGYVVNRYLPGPDDDRLLTQDARMNLNIAGVVQTIELKLKATLSVTNSLKNFDFSFHSPFYRMHAVGTVTGNRVDYRLTTGTNTIRDSLTFSTPPLLATSRRAYLLAESIKEGEKRRIPWFDPVSLTGKESVLEYKGKESVLINGRMQKLHLFIESFSGARVSTWLNDSGVVVKEESPAGFVFLKEPKFKALEAVGESGEILEAVAVKTRGELTGLDGSTMRYRLELPDEVSFELDGGRQTFVDGILTVAREELPSEPPTPAAPTCPDGAAQLAASPYIQADSREIKELAGQITAATEEPLTKVKKLATWVYENIEKRPVLGLPDALTTLAARQGDCNEHAALFAALARAAAIPTRVAAGVTRQREAFYYHAWNEVCLGDRWISIDTTTNQFPADLTHLRFIVGEMQEQVRIGALLGTLTIEPLGSATAN
ncbi:MAG: hypothetical protein A2X81_03650 [Desulfobacterales bacterium GWB2_56_26]|nr:MAG: hypothetical protein A2X81_03650 [Desulfobacterales bacterium GWB2_56_26]